MSSSDEPSDPINEPPRRLTHDDVADIPPIDEIHLLAWLRERRRLWLVAVPGLGIIPL